MNHVEIELNGNSTGFVKLDGIDMAGHTRGLEFTAHVGDVPRVTLSYIVNRLRYRGPADIHHEMPDLVDAVVRLVDADNAAGARGSTIRAHVERAIDLAVNRVLSERTPAPPDPAA